MQKILHKRFLSGCIMLRNLIKPKAKFTTWLYTICRNTCIKALKKKNHNVFSLSQGEGSSEYIDDASSSPEAAAIRDEKSRLVKEAIDMLPDTQRMALIFHIYEKLYYEQISQVMKCTEKAVKSLLYRAKNTLRQKLGPYFKNIIENSETYIEG